MKIKLLLLLFMFLAVCASPAPEIVYAEITPEPTSSKQVSPEFYFNSWESSGAAGMFFVVDDYYLIFAKGEAAALHEVGHLANSQRGYPSQSPEFEAAVIAYLDRCEFGEQPCWRINYFYQDGRLDDCYSEIYMWDILYTIPHEFEEFYAR